MHLSEKKYLRANEVPFMTRVLHNTIIKGSRYRNKIKVKQAGKIIKFSETYVRNYSGKPKKWTLIQKKSRIAEPPGKLMFLFSQKRIKR